MRCGDPRYHIALLPGRGCIALHCTALPQEARGVKRGSREAEIGLLALDGLHRSLLPFVLRRTKGQVLADLPPKMISDVYCDLSDMQVRLYANFQQRKAGGSSTGMGGG